MSERCLDRKSVQEVVLPVEPTPVVRTVEESEEIPPPTPPLPPAPSTAAPVETFPFEQQPTTTTTTVSGGPKCEQRGREALWDLFQSECAFLYDHLMVLKNVTSPSYLCAPTLI